MSATIALLPGDGIGPEITEATRQVLAAASKKFSLGLTYRPIAVGFEALARDGSTFPETAMAQLADCDGVVLGPVSHNDYPPRDQGGLNPSGELRKRLDLFANIRPARTRGDVPAKAGSPLDLIIVRENTEGFYADRSLFQGPGEVMVTEDVALATRVITRKACLRIAEEAFRIAETRSGRVTAVHKANVMRTTCGLFLECCRSVADRHPGVAYQEQLVDAMCAHLVSRPQEHDVVVTTNMFGDILSDLASELAGGLGLAASLNANQDKAMAQAQHGSAPDIAGLGVANPSSLIGSGAMLLDWVARRRGDERFAAAAAAIENALERTLRDPSKRTPDLGGSSTTTAFTAALIDVL